MTSHAAAVERQAVADALLRCGPWHAGHSDDALCDHARAQARAVARDAADLGDPVYAYQRAARRAEQHHLTPPDDYGVRGGLARLSCARWWRRQLRCLSARRCEQRKRILGKVHDRDGIYISQEGFRRRLEQQARNRAMLEEVEATNQDEQTYTLAQLADLGLANPEHRRAELMLRIGDTEKEANRLGHVGMFYTLTCPSRFHAVHHGIAKLNRKYDGSDPREAQAYLTHLWARARAKLGREGLGIYGIRVVEPHHDGTPHWHLLVWMTPEDEPAVTAILRAYALADSPEEVARRKGDSDLEAMEREHRRFKPVWIDPTRGTAAGYVAKYIAKSIAGKQHARSNVEGDHLDHYGHHLTTSAPRIEAWASTWGIRQFQFIGLPSVTVWREVRRLKEDAAVDAWEAATRPDPEAAAILGELRRAANAGRWAEFLRLMGGPMAGRQAQPVRPWRVVRQDAAGALADEATGEVTFDALGRYGEPVAGTWGLTVTSETGQADYLTRLYRWEITPRPAARAVDLEGLGGGEAAAPWTGVTNCTVQAEREARPHYKGRFHGLRFMGWKPGKAGIESRTPKAPLARWERRITESCRAMWPPVYQSQIDRLRERSAADYAAYRAAGEREALIREAARRDRAADRQRLEQGRQAIAGALLAGTLTPDDLTPETVELLTA